MLDIKSFSKKELLIQSGWKPEHQVIYRHFKEDKL